MTSHSIKNLAFRSLLRWKVIIPILATSLIHFSSKGWENVLPELGSEWIIIVEWVVQLSDGGES